MQCVITSYSIHYTKLYEKERVIHTRVPESLDEEVKRRAGSLGLSQPSRGGRSFSYNFV